MGYDADFAVVDLQQEQTVSCGYLQGYADWSLYEGWRAKGWPVATVVRGEFRQRDGQIVNQPTGVRKVRSPLVSGSAASPIIAKYGSRAG